VKTTNDDLPEALLLDAGDVAQPTAGLGDLLSSARAASDFLKALSHEHRLLLLCLLCEGERSVGELETALSLRQAAVSQQLARLRLDGLVSARRMGKTVYYSIADEKAQRIVRLIHEMFCGAPKGR
jgi:DNA-binding transcriptional ArsR family regulator